ncbi:unnamed protein product [Ilex paraguariensis]|uniref:Uncharacterized protein n=1 Tax=Ilex paraguariensis TaxID=185542 RepID=A0ABC8SUY8_9AQUA
MTIQNLSIPMNPYITNDCKVKHLLTSNFYSDRFREKRLNKRHVYEDIKSYIMVSRLIIQKRAINAQKWLLHKVHRYRLRSLQICLHSISILSGSIPSIQVGPIIYK